MVGAMQDLSTMAVLSTLRSSFPYCRGFKDPLGDADGATNMVRLNLFF